MSLSPGWLLIGDPPIADSPIADPPIADPPIADRRAAAHQPGRFLIRCGFLPSFGITDH